MKKLLTVLSFSLLLSACSLTGSSSDNTGGLIPPASPSSSPSPTTAVSITAEGYNPSSITIAPGQTVTWRNNDVTSHTVNSDPHPQHTNYPPLNLGPLNPGDTKSLSFPIPGTYTYHDHFHPNLKGTVIVQ